MNIFTLRCENIHHLESPAGNNHAELDLSVHKHSLRMCSPEWCSTTTNSMKCALIALQTRLVKT